MNVQKTSNLSNMSLKYLDKKYNKEVIPFNLKKIMSLVFKNCDKSIIDSSSSSFNIKCIENFDFYYYNCEFINDYNWGCAWRCIQMVLSSLIYNNIIVGNKELIKFDLLFYNYGSKDSLVKIFNKLNNKDIYSDLPSYFLTKNEFAPFDNKYNWAEPFIAQLIVYDKGIKGKLILINGYPENAFAPKEVFEKDIYTFNDFKNLLISYFNSSKKVYPMIIDNSISTYCIIGICINKKCAYDSNDKITIDLIIADPHVKINESYENYIYVIELNESGNPLNHNKTFDFKKDNYFMLYYIDI